MFVVGRSVVLLLTIERRPAIITDLEVIQSSNFSLCDFYSICIADFIDDLESNTPSPGRHLGGCTDITVKDIK